VVFVTRVSNLHHDSGNARLCYRLHSSQKRGDLLAGVFTKGRVVLPIVLFFFGVSCSTLRPIDQPHASTAAPSNAPVWRSLESGTDDWFVLLDRGPAALDWRLRAIDTATESIDLQTFLWSLDTVGSKVLDHLVAAAARGVKVKLLIDDSFLLGEDQLLLDLHQHDNIEYRVYNPYRHRVDGFATRAALNLGEFHRLDHRMHNKAMVVDNRIAIVGGRNLADEYFGLHEQTNFRDLELITGGTIVEDVAQVFDAYWNNHWSVPIDQVSHVSASHAELEAVQEQAKKHADLHAEETAEQRLRMWNDLVAGAHRGSARLLADLPPQKSPESPDEAPVQLAQALLEVFNASQHDVLIVSAYLIPTPNVELLVQDAVKRGVRVRILTNSIASNNHLSAHSAYRNHIETLLNHGAQLFEVRTDADDRSEYMLTPVEGKALALHAKALVFDRDQTFVGSLNFDPRSFRINTEMGLLVQSESLAASFRAAVARDFDAGNSWHLEKDEKHGVIWVSDKATLTRQPATSFMQRIEDWFFSRLPVEGEL
jgi:putative cardiolipin synthase